VTEPKMRCPFCGNGIVGIDGDGWHSWVKCPDCGASGPIELNALRAVEAWDTRESGLQEVCIDTLEGCQTLMRNLEQAVVGDTK